MSSYWTILEANLVSSACLLLSSIADSFSSLGSIFSLLDIIVIVLSFGTFEHHPVLSSETLDGILMLSIDVFEKASFSIIWSCDSIENSTSWRRLQL